MRGVAVRSALFVVAAVGMIAGLSPAVRANDLVRIGGTGMGLRAMERLGEQFTRANDDAAVRVLPSLGTAGGINALIDGAIEIALAARQITPGEQQKGLAQAACMTTALVFATSKAPSNMDEDITSERLPAIYADPHPLWPDRTPIKIVLRSRTASEVPYLVEKIPAMASAFEQAYKRGGLPVGLTDQENVGLAVQMQGSLAITTLLQIRAENIALRPLRFDGVAPTDITLANSRYPLPLQMCLFVTATPARSAARFVAHMKTPQGAALLRSLGAEINK